MSHPEKKECTEEEVARRLRATEAPDPPLELLQQIQEEIPEEIFPPEREVWLGSQPSRWQQARRWLAAAGLGAVALTGGWLALRTGEQVESPETVLTPTPSVEHQQSGKTEVTIRGQDRDHSAAEAPLPVQEAPPVEPVPRMKAPESAPQIEAEPLPSAAVGDQDSEISGTVGRENLRESLRQGLRLDDRNSGTQENASEPSVRAKKVPIPDPTPEEPEAVAEGYFPPPPPPAPRVHPPPAAPAQPPRYRAPAPAAQGDVPKPRAQERQEQEREMRQSLDAVHRRLEEVPAAPAPPSTGGTREPNDQPYGDVFFEGAGTNPFVDTEDDPLSTFGFDVDTGSYSVVRRYLTDGHLPPADAVRVEEMINYFDYRDAPPRRGDFALHGEGAPALFPQGPRYHLLRLAAQGREVHARDRQPAILTFVVDISGSMARENRLGLVKDSLVMLLDQLRREDQVALVVFGNAGRLVLPPTSDKVAIERAIHSLQPEGATNAEEGLLVGYQVAARNARRDTINRVILCSDGVANVGNTGPESILRRIRRGVEEGIELTTLGFGMGNYNDVLMEQLADQGQGRYAYIDTLDEAHRVLVEELTGTLQTIAYEARAQVEFDPQVVERYRLIGYENRDIADERFRDDTVDAGEIGAGHHVTALYELKLTEGYEAGDRRAPVATFRVRYRSQETDRFEEVERRITLGDFAPHWQSASRDLRLASTVAEFGEILKGTYWARGNEPRALLRHLDFLAEEAVEDPEVRELISLVEIADRLQPRR